MRACICPDRRSPEVAMTLRPRLGFWRSTEKSEGVRSDRAESTTTISNGG